MNTSLQKNVGRRAKHKPKQGNVFREFRVDIMNVDVYYDNEEESNNTSDRIAGVIPEETNELNTVKTRISYNDAVQTGNGQKTALYTH